MSDQSHDLAADALELNHQYLAGYHCAACLKRFYLPSHDCAEAIIAGLCCPRCGSERVMPSGWCQLFRQPPTVAPAPGKK